MYLTAAIILCIANIVNAQLEIPKIFGNNMVLQRDKPIPVWGTAGPGQMVTVKFSPQEKITKADTSGKWNIQLEALPASFDPEKLIISSAGKKIELSNILVGEVWLCSGQSNMEYTMRRNSKVTVPEGVKTWPVNELESAHNKSIRIFLVERKKMKPDSTHLGWNVAEDSALRSFSAVGYFFAKELYKTLQVPVGIISASIPGSRIEPWMPEEAMLALPFFKNPADTISKISGEPGKFYSSMIEPIAPFALKGFLWYQGESNCFLNERLQYAYKMKALINYWRKEWNSNSLPFYYVQIAPFAYSKAQGDQKYTEQSLPEFWEAQEMALKIPSTGMVATCDLNTDLDNLHPHFKWEIGRRLATCALGKVYAKREIVPMGPFYTGMRVSGNSIILDFKYTGSGLVSRDGKDLNGFEIAGSDGKYVTAVAVIKNDQVIVSSPQIQQPVSVRFAWNERAHTNLYNLDELPAMSFRTDNPLVEQFK